MAKADLPIIKKSDIVIDSRSRIGEGQFGTVYKAKWRGQIVAVKVLNSTTANIDGFYKEAQIMAKVGNHQNIVRLMGVCLEENHTSIVSQFYPQGSCYKVFVQEKRTVPWVDLLKVVKGAAAGVLHLHAENYIHRDIASRNILISDSFEGVVTDFGMSRLQLRDGSQSITYLGPVKWMAPESIRDKIISKATDVYMFGSFMWELIMREIPYGSEDPLVSAVRVIQQGCTLIMPSDCHPSYLKLMIQCLKTAPEERPSFVEILSALELMYDEAEHKSLPPSVAPPPRNTTPSRAQLKDSLGEGNYIVTDPVFDLSDLKLDSSPSPFSQKLSPSSKPSPTSSPSPHTPTITTTNASNTDYLDTNTSYGSAGYLDNSSLGFLPRPGFEPRPSSPGTTKGLPPILEGYLETMPSGTPNYLQVMPSLSINANGYIFTTSELPKSSTMTASGPTRLQASSSSSQSSSSSGPITRAKSNSDSLPNPSSAPPARFPSSPLDYSSSSNPGIPITSSPDPNGPPRAGQLPISSSYPPVGVGGPNSTSPTLGSTQGSVTVPAPSGGYNKRPLSGGAVRFGNTSDSPMRGTINLYSNRVIPSPELLGWKPQFSLEHTFRKPTITRPSSTASPLLSNTSAATPVYPASVQQRSLSNSASASSGHYSPITYSGNVNPSYPLPLYNGQPATHNSGIAHSGSGRAIGHSGPAALRPGNQHQQQNASSPFGSPVSPSYTPNTVSHSYNVTSSGSFSIAPQTNHGATHGAPQTASSGHVGVSGHKSSGSVGSNHMMNHSVGHSHAGMAHSGSGPQLTSGSPTPSSGPRYHYPPPSGYNSVAGGGNASGNASSPTNYQTPSGYPPSSSPVYYPPSHSQSTHYNTGMGLTTLKGSYPPSTGPVSPTYAPLPSPSASDYPQQPYYPQQSAPNYHLAPQTQPTYPSGHQYNKPLPTVPSPSPYNKPLPAVPGSSYKDVPSKTSYPPTY